MIDGLSSFISGVGEDVVEFVSEKPITSAGIGVGVLGTTGLIVAGVSKRKATTKKRKKTSKKTKKGRSRDRRFRSKQKHELAYVKRKRKAGKKITRPRYKTKKTKKPRRLIKGSKEAKRYMAKIRRMKK